MFHNARIKLTAWYLLIIVCVSVSFSAVIYRVLTFEMDRLAERQEIRIERQLEQQGFVYTPPARPISATQRSVFDPDLIHETKRRLVGQLVLINVTIFVLSGAFGYLLAGKTLQPIAAMIEEQRRFISDASHELRTPLTAIKSSIEVAMRDKDLSIEETKKLLKENIDDVNTLQTLTDELLSLARLETERTKLQQEPINLATVVMQAIKRIGPIAQKSDVTLQKETVSVSVFGNASALTDCCVVLLDNAIKYSPRHSTVTVTLTKENGEAKIRVRDHGIGIGQKDLPHIFDRFYRADVARSKSATTGYGLGLSIAKKIIEEHRGKITAQSGIHKGSTFLIALPVYKNNA